MDNTFFSFVSIYFTPFGEQERSLYELLTTDNTFALYGLDPLITRQHIQGIDSSVNIDTEVHFFELNLGQGKK